MILEKQPHTQMFVNTSDQSACTTNQEILDSININIEELLNNPLGSES